jgi:hypothetical protein
MTQNTDALYIGRDVFFSGSQAHYDMPVCLYWQGKFLSDAQHKAYAQNIWQLFQPISREIFAEPAPAGGVSSAVASSAGSGAASGTAASTFASTASSAGSATASGTGASTFASTASSSGIATANAVGSSAGVTSAVGSSSGSGLANGVGVGLQTISAAASSAGVATANAVGSTGSELVGVLRRRRRRPLYTIGPKKKLSTPALKEEDAYIAFLQSITDLQAEQRILQEALDVATAQQVKMVTSLLAKIERRVDEIEDDEAATFLLM